MTDRKSLKRRVRARMTKTGERYTAARRNLLAKPTPADAADNGTGAADNVAPDAADNAAPDAADNAAPDAVPTGNFRGNRDMSEEIFAARTGRPWDEWYEILTSWGAIDRPHPEIARWLVEEHGVDGWWAQEVTVRYEVASGRRKPGQRADGAFSATASKTIAVPAERAFDAFVDEDLRRRWLPVDGLKLRTATPHRSIRFDWPGGTQRLVVWLDRKGEAKVTAGVEHTRLADEAAVNREKAVWRERLAELKRLLET